MTIYNQVKQILEKYPATREDDRLLEWMYLVETGYVTDGVIDKESFLLAPPMESIRRQRQIIQNERKLFTASKQTQIKREEKRKQFPVWVFNNDTGTCYMA